MYGAPHLYEARAHRLKRTLGQQGITLQNNVSARSGEMHASAFKALYTATSTNTHNFMVCHQREYLGFVELLSNTSTFQVGGVQFRYWIELLPPTEASASGDDCDVPPDSPLTPFNETALFTNATRGYMDYAAWGALPTAHTQCPHPPLRVCPLLCS